MPYQVAKQSSKQEDRFHCWPNMIEFTKACPNYIVKAVIYYVIDYMLLGDATTLQTAILGALKLDLTCCYTTS